MEQTRVDSQSGCLGSVKYQKLLLQESGSEEEEEEEDETESGSQEEEEGEDDMKTVLILDPGHPRALQANPAQNWQSRLKAWAGILSALLLLGLSFYLAARQLRPRGASNQDQEMAASKIQSLDHHPSGHHHNPGIYPHGVVISESDTCSILGRDLLLAGGNVVDAGVGTALCLALVHPHETGLGAVFWALFHNSSSNQTMALTPAPAQALAPGLGMPGALPALHLLHRNLGHLPWSRLLAATIALAQDGFSIDQALAEALAEQDAAGQATGLCPLLCHPNGTVLGQGTRVTNLGLAAVLQRAAQAPETDDQFLSALLHPLAEDLLLKEPLKGIMPTLEPALRLALPQGLLFTTPSPTAGELLLKVLRNPLQAGGLTSDPCPGFLAAAQDAYSGVTPAAPVGSILAAMDSEGSVLLLVSSLNSTFGSGWLSPSTGILLSDFMGGSQIASWACPALLCCGPEVDVLALAASGGSSAPLAVAKTLLSYLALQQPLPDAVTQPQLQIQLSSTGAPRSCRTTPPKTGAPNPEALLLVTTHAEHVRATGVPASCYPSRGH
ncbi:glutathione hydrolase 6 isoform X1 [Vombatus ursinus]|uniref:glutathione hydrolase 6 isoform X1 n=1 Tax=Vombatus ursinus TaxID=29139 RepID=UPI000FFD1BF3|nr:glutathione hydrolase 6 isoform X1 [Vombatus ursinus]